MVADGVAGRDRSLAVDGAGGRQQAFEQGRLAASALAGTRTRQGAGASSGGAARAVSTPDGMSVMVRSIRCRREGASAGRDRRVRQGRVPDTEVRDQARSRGGADGSRPCPIVAERGRTGPGVLGSDGGPRLHGSPSRAPFRGRAEPSERVGRRGGAVTGGGAVREVRAIVTVSARRNRPSTLGFLPFREEGSQSPSGRRASAEGAKGRVRLGPCPHGPSGPGHRRTDSRTGRPRRARPGHRARTSKLTGPSGVPPGTRHPAKSAERPGLPQTRSENRNRACRRGESTSCPKAAPSPGGAPRDGGPAAKLRDHRLGERAPRASCRRSPGLPAQGRPVRGSNVMTTPQWRWACERRQDGCGILTRAASISDYTVYVEFAERALPERPAADR